MRSGVELAGPQKHPSAEVARLAFHLERIAAELASTREALAKTRGELDASSRTETQLQKYVDRFEDKAASRIKSLEAKLEEMTAKFHASNLQIASLKNALEVAAVKNNHLEERLRTAYAAAATPRGFFDRLLHPHAQA